MHSVFNKLVYSNINTVRRIKDHACSLNVRIDETCYHIREGFLVLQRRRFRQYLIISYNHPRTYTYFRSGCQIDTEIQRHLLRHYYAIHPLSIFRYNWDRIMVFAYLINIIMISAESCLRYDEGLPLLIIKLILDTICMIDIVFNFCTGYYDDRLQHIQLNFTKIAKNYVSTFFFFDLLSSLPIGLYFEFSEDSRDDHRYLGLFLYLKLVRIQTVINNLPYFIKEPERFSLIKGIIMFFTLLLYSTAIANTILDYSGILDIQRTAQFGHNLFEFMLHLCAYYTSLLFLIDNGVTTNKFTSLLYMEMIWIVLGAVLNILIFGSMMRLYSRYNNVSNKNNDLIREFTQYMSYKGLSPMLKIKIDRFIKFRYKTNLVNEKNIFSNLSTTLQQDIMLHKCKTFVEKVRFFKGLPTDVMLRIVNKFRMEIFVTNDVIFQAGVQGHTMYFIYAGKVAVYTSTFEEMCHLSEGAHFGEIALLSNSPRTATVVAITECELYRLSRKDFLEAIDPFPEFKQKISQMADDRLQKIKAYQDDMSTMDDMPPIDAVEAQFPLQQSDPK